MKSGRTNLALGAAFEAQLLLVGLVVLLLVSSSVHYANEYADYETDALTPRTWFSGGSGALPGSTMPRRVALRAGWAGLAAGSTLALFGWATGALNPTALYPLALGTFLGWMYSLPPEPRWRLYWAVAALFFLMFPLLVGWSIPPRVAWSSYLVASMVILGGYLYTKSRSPLPSVAAMIMMAVVQFGAWFSLLAV